MRLTDIVFRHGHLSDRALVEVWLSGNRPAHLDRCDICSDRAVEMSRWLDEVRTTGIEAADAVFTPERLAVQQSQILRKLEQLDQPPRVIAFPGQSRPISFEPAGRGVAPAWVGLAAAAGLVLGVVGGHFTARAGNAMNPIPPIAEARNLAPMTDQRVIPSDADLIESDFTQTPSNTLGALESLMPRDMQSATSGQGKSKK